MQTKQILPLTSLRFFAAAWVVLFHIPFMVGIGPILHGLAPVTQLGHEAVAFFFLLSGFILSYNYFPNYSISAHPQFVFWRFARLWPVHFVTLMLIGAPLLWNKSRVEELLMVRIWFHDNIDWNTPAWSLSSEWFAYIFIFPLAFFLFKRIRWVPGLIVIVGLCLVAQTFSAYLFLFPVTSLCGRILFLFLAGSGLYRIRCLAKNAPAERIVTAGILLLLGYLVFQKSLSVMVLYTGYSLLIFGLSYERGAVARALSVRPLVLGGLASYSLYMTHLLSIRLFIYYYSWPYLEKWEGSIFAHILAVLALFGFLGAITALFYVYVEVPGNRALRHLWKKYETNRKQAGQTPPMSSVHEPNGLVEE